MRAREMSQCVGAQDRREENLCHHLGLSRDQNNRQEKWSNYSHWEIIIPRIQRKRIQKKNRRQMPKRKHRRQDALRKPGEENEE